MYTDMFRVTKKDSEYDAPLFAALLARVAYPVGIGRQWVALKSLPTRAHLCARTWLY